MPRWAGLNHFFDYINEEFSDGSKWEDMSKVCHDTIVCHFTYSLSVISPDMCPRNTKRCCVQFNK